MARHRLLLLALGALFLASACAHGGSGGSGDVTVTYASSAKQNYELGMKELEGKNWLEAAKYFQFVSARYPYSSYAALAELASADTEYAQDKYVEAADKYRNFTKLHPSHPKVDYAAFRVGMCSFEQIPSDLFFLPPSSEKDQTDVKNALAEFNEFLRDYPHSTLLPDAQAKVAELRHRLADHEMRIGAFYENHEHPQAAAGRYETVVRDYAHLGFDPEALIHLGRLYLQVKEPDKAHLALEKLIKEYPQDKRIAEAKKLLAQK